MTTALVIPRAPSKQIHSSVPRLWQLWMQHHGASPRLATTLWRLFCRQATPAQLFLFRQADHPRGSVGPMLAAIPPKMILELTLLVAPENGRRRDPEVVRLEESILRACTKEGVWY